jgi:ATP-dependent exoDNAse (exonuclease V) beta subunit
MARKKWRATVIIVDRTLFSLDPKPRPLPLASRLSPHPSPFAFLISDPGHPLSGEEWYDTSTVTEKKRSAEHEGRSPYQFPHIMVLKASAGSGKTHALTLRYVEFLMNSAIPRNDLRNILAITFSNNAAKEMKERVLRWLKSACIGDPVSIQQLRERLPFSEQELKDRASMLLDRILDTYADFQVRTIDSFMATVFKSSAIDFGFDPDFEIVMDSSRLIGYSFDLYLRRVREGSAEARLMQSAVSGIAEHREGGSAYYWDPTAAILKELRNIYRKLSSTRRELLFDDLSAEMTVLRKRMADTIAAIEAEIAAGNLKRHGNSSFRKMPDLAAEGRFVELIGRGCANAPVTKPAKNDAAAVAAYDCVCNLWDNLASLVRQFSGLYARSFFTPYLRIFSGFRDTLEMVKRQQEKVFIEDINRVLADYIDRQIVPDIYFRIGDTVYHYLIDEFQDTSPVQWDNLLPLVENSLSQGGSLFVVGDTKQAIYGFRYADYTIMQELERGGYLSLVRPTVDGLTENFRSRPEILKFVDAVFKKTMAANPDYGEAALRSGLADYEQTARDCSGDAGHVEAIVLDRDDEGQPERERIVRTIGQLQGRGFSLSDIAVLTQRNEDAVRVSGWLNEAGIDFISYSNLDIRRRRITGEVIALLNFLDSPIDDHAFSTFLLGEIFRKTCTMDAARAKPEDLHSCILTARGEPVYKVFQRLYPQMWDRYFDGLFRVAGYFPVYDLVTEAFSVFRVFESCGHEEATLVKILEVIREFEGAGFNSLRDFIEFADDEDADDAGWNMDVPKGVPAVRVMTIHKAKGLGFPAVIVMLYATRQQPFDFVEQAEGDRMRLLKLTRGICASEPDLQPLYDEAVAKDLVNRLNALYVGFTRAGEEMYVIGVKGPRDKQPFDLLPAEDFPEASRVERSHTAKEEEQQPCGIIHRTGSIRRQPASYGILAFAERRRGELIHDVLSRVATTLPDAVQLRALIEKAKAETGIEWPDDEIVDAVTAVLDNPNAAEYFAEREGRVVFTEREMADQTGRLLRIDRLVIDHDTAIVLDFKTGREGAAAEHHAEQVRHYLSVVAALYPGRAVRGLLVYVDINRAVEVA